MALVLKDRVKETTTTTGTGTLTLAGAASGFQSFSVIGDGNTTYYTIDGGNEWEVGIGTYTLLGTTLSRDTILESSNSGSAVNFSAGTKNVFVTYPAERALYTDASSNAIALGTPASATLTNATGLPISTGVSGLGANVATFLATPSSANLASAVTDETGSGSLVFGTSPTIDSPTFTSQATFAAGTATAPAFTTTGDTNTGIFFPTADTIAFAEGGTEAMRLDSSGNVGIGTTSPVGTGLALNIQNSNSSVITAGSASNANFVALYSGQTVDPNPSLLFTGELRFGTATSPTTAGYVERMRIGSSGDLLFDSGYGSVATAYGCRAWVNFNGTGTPAIVGSGNISSITDNGTGDYTLNFTTSMSDANYTAVFGQAVGSTSTNNYVQGIRITGSSATGTATTKTTSALRIQGRSAAGSSADCEQNNVAIFR